MPTHDVISAFLDNEPFDPATLAAALAESDGRELLLDLVALRAVVNDGLAPVADVRLRTAERRRWAAVGFFAATFVFAVGLAAAWPRFTAPPAPAADAPPTPTRVVSFEPGLDWHDDTPSGVQK
jgi:hypothetical protein